MHTFGGLLSDHKIKMKISIPAHDLAKDIALRSTCRDKVGAVIFDSHGIFSWGWNHAGFNGNGMHAEHHAIWRGNRKRMKGATIVVARFKPTGVLGISKPCDLCIPKIMKAGIVKIVYLNRDGDWSNLEFFS